MTDFTVWIQSWFSSNFLEYFLIFIIRSFLHHEKKKWSLKVFKVLLQTQSLSFFLLCLFAASWMNGNVFYQLWNQEKVFFKRSCWLLEASLALLRQTRSLIQTFFGSITPRLHIKHFFLPTGWTIRSLLSGPESGGCEGSKKWARSLWIIPLFQLLWPGMPNFTARFSSLCVNQSFARGPRRPQSPPPSPHDPSPPWSLTRSHGSILQLLPSEVLFQTTIYFF